MNQQEKIWSLEFQQRKEQNNLNPKTHQDKIRAVLKGLDTKDNKDMLYLFHMRGISPLEKRADGTFLGKKEQGSKEAGGYWENIAEHSLMVTFVADVLGEALGLTNEDRKKVNQAAFIHDSQKKTERMWQLAIDNADPNNSEADELSMTLEQKADAKKSAMEAIAQMEDLENAELEISPEVMRLSRSNVPKNAEGHSNPKEKIIWFADACVSGDQIVSIPQRFNDLVHSPSIPEARRAANKAFSESFSQRYNGKTLYEVQVSLGEKYVDEFVKHIPGVTKETFYGWLQNKVAERLHNQKLPLLQ